MISPADCVESGSHAPSCVQPSAASSLCTAPAVSSLPRDDPSTSTVATEETGSESEFLFLPDYLILSNCETGRLHHARYASSRLAVASSSGCMCTPLSSCCRQGRDRSLSTTTEAEACGTPSRMTHAFQRCGFPFQPCIFIRTLHLEDEKNQRAIFFPCIKGLVSLSVVEATLEAWVGGCRGCSSINYRCRGLAASQSNVCAFLPSVSPPDVTAGQTRSAHWNRGPSTTFLWTARSHCPPGTWPAPHALGTVLKRPLPRGPRLP